MLGLGVDDGEEICGGHIEKRSSSKRRRKRSKGDIGVVEQDIRKPESKRRCERKQEEVEYLCFFLKMGSPEDGGE